MQQQSTFIALNQNWPWTLDSHFQFRGSSLVEFTYLLASQICAARSAISGTPLVARHSPFGGWHFEAAKNKKLDFAVKWTPESECETGLESEHANSVSMLSLFRV